MPTPRPECTRPAEDRAYPKTEEAPPFAELEEEILAYWEADDTFAATQDPARADQDVFGNGSLQTFSVQSQPLPGLEPRTTRALVTGYQLDTLGRFFTMQGQLATRPFGLQGHGLAIEREVQRKLKLKDQKAIEAYGVEAYVAACEVRALERAEYWDEFLPRQGRWADSESAVHTWELPYQESVIWAFKTLFDKGLVEHGTDYEYFCTRCETVVEAPFETGFKPPSSEYPSGVYICASCGLALQGMKKVPRWILRVESIEVKIKETIRQVSWLPARVRDELLAWSTDTAPLVLSRSRYWGTALPVFGCSKPKCQEHLVVGNLAEIQSGFGAELSDLHPGEIDSLSRPCACKKGQLRRLPGTLAPWFEAACAPFARHHAPFENEDEFRASFPASFSGGQFEDVYLWLFPALVVSVALFDETPFLSGNVTSTNLPARILITQVEDDDGDPALRVEARPIWLDPEDAEPVLPGNLAPSDPRSFFRPLPSDAFRVCFLRGLDPDEWGQGLEVVHRVWGTFHFFCTSANAERVHVPIEVAKPSVPPPPWRSTTGWPPEVGGESHPANPLDRFLLSALARGAAELEDLAKKHRLAPAYARLEQVLDELAAYLAASRTRFLGPKGDPDKAAAFRTLHRGLILLARILAPFLPFLAEVIYLSLSEGRSVHLERWPDGSTIPFDEEIYLRIRAEHSARGV